MNVLNVNVWWHHHLVAMFFRHPCQGNNQHLSNASQLATDKFQLWISAKFCWKRIVSILFHWHMKKTREMMKRKEQWIRLMKLIKLWHISKQHTNKKKSHINSSKIVSLFSMKMSQLLWIFSLSHLDTDFGYVEWTFNPGHSLSIFLLVLFLCFLLSFQLARLSTRMRKSTKSHRKNHCDFLLFH